MVNFFNGLFANDAKKAKVGEAVARATSISGGYGNSFNDDTGFNDLGYAISRGMERVTWVATCVDLIAKMQASVPMTLRQYTLSAQGQDKYISRIDRLLNRRANPYEDAFVFRQRLSMQLLLSSKGAFIETIKSDAGVIVELYLLPPSQVEPVRDPKKFVAGYMITRDDGATEMLPPDRVVWIKAYPHPDNPYRQLPPLVSAKLAVETDWLAKMFNRNFLRNDGRPGTLIALNGQVDPEDAKEIRNRFEGGGSTAGRTMVIEAESMQVQDMSGRPRDMQWDEAIRGSKEEILAAFKVPDSMLGNAAGRCLRQTENVHLSDGSVKPASELVGKTFKLLQPTTHGIIEVDGEASWDKTTKIYRITTFSGRTLETNGKHPLQMAQVSENQRFKERVVPFGWTPMEAIKSHYDRYDSHDTGVYTEVAVPYNFPHVPSTHMDEDDAYDAGVKRSVVPDIVFTSQKDAQLAFLSGLYSERGRMSQHSSFDMVVPTHDYAERLQRLLLRVGVHGSITVEKEKHVVKIGHKVNMLSFLAQIDLTGPNKDRANAVFARLSTKTMPSPLLNRTFGLHDGLMWDRVLSVEEIGTDKTVAVTVPNGNTYLSLFWEHNTYNNAGQEVENFWNVCMKPHCNSIANGLDAVTGVVGDDLYVEFDYSTVDVLQAALRRRYDKAAQDLARGAISLDDYRKVIGEKPLNLPGSRVYIHPSGLVIGNEDDVDAVSQAYVIGQRGDAGSASAIGTPNPFLQGATATGGTGTVGGVADQIQGEVAANGADATQSINQIAARAMRSADGTGADDNSANPNANTEVSDRIEEMRNKALRANFKPQQKQILEAFVVGSLDNWAAHQLEVVTERIDHVKARKGTRHWVGEEKSMEPLDVEYAVKSENWYTDPVIIKRITKYVENSFDVNEKQIEYIQDSLKSYLTRHTDNLKNFIAQEDSLGHNVAEIKANTAKAFDDQLSNDNSQRVARWINDIVFGD